MNLNNRLLLFANDPASANVTSAYANLNKELYTEILAFPYNDVAKSIYTEYIPKYIKEKPICFEITDTVVTGTSGIDPSYEMNAIVTAKKAKVSKIITLVDNTIHFNSRFIYKNKLLAEKYLPDEMWLFDRNFTSTIDYINKKIIYKEDIYNQFLQLSFNTTSPNIVHPFIKRYKNDYLVILTEYIYDFYRLNFGFTEYDMLESILNEVNYLKLNIPIFLKLHPKEHSNKFNILLRKYSHLNITKDTCNIQELIFYSKLVFGINSSVFKECSVFEKPTYSIQIDAIKINKSTLLKPCNIITQKEKLNDLLKEHFI